MNKKVYECPEIEIIRFRTENILDGSGIELPDHEWSLKKVRAFEVESSVRVFQND